MMRQVPKPETTLPGVSHLRDSFGLCQWFHFQDYASVHRTVRALDDLGVRHLRTGISWADYHRPGGVAWYDWLFETLGRSRLELLVSVWHTPPSLAEGGACSGPPRNLKDYADFIDVVVTRYGNYFATLELWNEPNNRVKWNFRDHDPDWSKFAAMIGMAAHWAHRHGMRTVLGGMVPVDHHWLDLMDRYGALRDIDVVAIHAFPGMWWPHQYCWDWEQHWSGWAAKIQYIRKHAGGREIWVTETGYATWDETRQQPGRYAVQSMRLRDALAAPVDRLYWYSAIDLASDRPCIEMTEDGGRIDHNEYHMGLITHRGQPKPAYENLREWLQPDEAEAAPSAARA